MCARTLAAAASDASGAHAWACDQLLAFTIATQAADQAQTLFTHVPLFTRSVLQDCYNRPISSAPGAWIDVMERTEISGRA